MKWFAERFSGWIIRIGPDAHQRPDPYLYALPFSDDGEFVGVSTSRLNCEAVRVATDAARTLGFEAPRWQHKEKITMAHQSLHSKHGAKLGTQLDQAEVIKIMELYLAGEKSGKVVTEGISEIDLGGGRYVRTVVCHEK